jgi:hypothetical protein
MSDPKTLPEMLDAAKSGKEFGDILMRMCARVEAELDDDDLKTDEDS